jgi:hypothetical protein
MVGADVYPAPRLVRVTPVMAPVELKVAAAVAPVAVALGSVMVTVGADVYPLPAAVTVKPVIAPAFTVAVAVAPEPPPPERVTVGVV